MGKIFLVMTLAGCALLARAETFLWSESLNDPGRWSGFNNGITGKWNFMTDDTEKAIRFDADFTRIRNGAGRACPAFRLLPMESLAGAEKLSFDIKIKPSEKHVIREAYFILDGIPAEKGGRINFVPSENGSYKTVTIRLRDVKSDLSKVKQIRIGFKPEGRKVTWHLRNLKIEGKNTGVARTKKYDTGLSLRAAAPGTMFYETEPLKFTAVIPGAASYTITDIYGKTMQTGTVHPGTLILKKLPRGYYFLTLRAQNANYAGKRSFAVVPNRVKLPAGKENNYAMVLAAHLGEARNKNYKETPIPGGCFSILPEICRRSGAFTVRDHIF